MQAHWRDRWDSKIYIMLWDWFKFREDAGKSINRTGCMLYVLHRQHTHEKLIWIPHTSDGKVKRKGSPFGSGGGKGDRLILKTGMEQQSQGACPLLLLPRASSGEHWSPVSYICVWTRCVATRPQAMHKIKLTWLGHMMDSRAFTYICIFSWSENKSRRTNVSKWLFHVKYKFNQVEPKWEEKERLIGLQHPEALVTVMDCAPTQCSDH